MTAWPGMRPAARRGLQVLLALSCSLALSVAGPLKPLDDWFYDALLTRVAQPGAPRVLVIEGQAAHMAAGDALWLRLLRTLRSAGARHIVFTTMPAQVSPAFYEAAERARVVFGRRLLHPPDRDAAPVPMPVPVAAAGLPLRLAVAEPWPSAAAVQRGQHGRFVTSQGSLPALEALAAADAGAAPQEQPYGIDFAAEPLPRLGIVAALSGELAPDLAGTVVVVGPAGDDAVFTPAGRMPALQFHAHAIDTLLREAAIAETPVMLRMLLLLGAAALALVLQRPPAQAAAPAAAPGRRRMPIPLAEVLVPAGLALLLLALSAGLLAGGWWLPPVGPVVALAIVAGAASVARRVRSDRALAALQADASARLGHLVQPLPEGRAADVWHEVRALVTHHLSLQRSLFLAVDPASGRLREALAIGCDFGAITERRRDVNRLPYRLVAAQRQAVESQQVLHRADADEAQFLMPLGVPGRLEGFWALGVQRAELQRAEDFHPTVNALAAEIARRLGLARRRAPLQTQQAAAEPPDAAAAGRAGGDPGAVVHRALRLLDQRAGSLRRALEHLDMAAAGFDELGQPLFVNAAMKRVLQDLALGAAPAAPALLAGVTGCDAGEVRELLCRVVVQGERVRLPAHRVRTGAMVQLTLTPLPPGPEGTALCGVLCELADVSLAVQRAEADELLRRRMRVQMAGRAAALTTASLRLAEGSPAVTDARQLRRVAEQVRNETMKAMQALEAVLRPEEGPPASRPVDLGGAVDRVLADLAGTLQARRIGVARTGRGAAAVLVRAEPGELHHVLKAVFELLLTDCAEAGEIWVESEEASGRVRCRFANTGSGMPNKKFLDYLGSAQPDVLPEFTRLRNASRLVHRWGATLRGASDVGLGTRFELTLQTA
jgi:CHASE2 domain-containing sensor protein